MLSELSSVYHPLGFVVPFLLHGRKITHSNTEPAIIRMG